MKTIEPGERIPFGLSRKRKATYFSPIPYGYDRVYLVLPLPMFWYGKYYDLKYDQMKIGWQYLHLSLCWWKAVQGVLFSKSWQFVLGFAPLHSEKDKEWSRQCQA